MQNPEQLRRFISEKFVLYEIRIICFDLGIDIDQLEGRTKDELIISLIQYMENRGRFEELITTIEKPHAQLFSESVKSSLLKSKSENPNNQIRGIQLKHVLIFLVVLSGGFIWWQYFYDTGWQTGKPIPEEKFAIAVGQFFDSDPSTAELISSESIEMSQLILQELTAEIQNQPDLKNIMGVTSIDISDLRHILAISSIEDNDAEWELINNRAAEVNADLIVGGWNTINSSASITTPRYFFVDKNKDYSSFLRPEKQWFIEGEFNFRVREVSDRAVAIARFILGLALIQDESEESHRKALEIINLGITELQEKYKDDDVSQTLANFYMVEGVAYKLVEDIKQADISYAKAIELENNNSQFKIIYADFLREFGQIDRAQILYEEVLLTDPNNIFANYGLGTIICNNGDIESSIEPLQKVIELLGTAAENAIIEGDFNFLQTLPQELIVVLENDVNDLCINFIQNN